MGISIGNIFEVVFYDRKHRPIGRMLPSSAFHEMDTSSYSAYDFTDFERRSKLVIEGYDWSFGFNSHEHYPAENVHIVKVIFNDPATIVLWSDDTKTVVKRQEDELMYDPEKGLAMAIAKKYFGNMGNYNNEFKKWLPSKETVPHVSPKTVTYSSDITAPSYESLAEAINTVGERLRKLAEQGK